MTNIIKAQQAPVTVNVNKYQLKQALHSLLTAVCKIHM